MWFKILLPNQHHPLAAIVGKDGKIYFRLVDVGTLLGRSNAYNFTKRFDTFVIEDKDVLSVHKHYPVMTQKSKLVTPDDVFNILNAELASLGTSFATSLNAGVALVEGNCWWRATNCLPSCTFKILPFPVQSCDYLEQEAAKGKGVFIQALWTLYAKSKLYSLAYKAWKRHGPLNMTTWTLLAQAVLDGCYGEKLHNTMFQVPDVVSHLSESDALARKNTV
ncbi:uncharacterized protein TNCV_2135431 [Trichonephila clavipes]|nr:uncharacterized protein TNCV_2135431 [Trichonephila clavipes]